MNNSAHQKVSLIAAGFLGLFLQLTLIRFLPANILSLAYFTNIVLISSFLGLGLGAILAFRMPDIFKWFPLALFVATLLIFGLQGAELIFNSPGGEWLWSYYYPGNIYNQFQAVFHLGYFSVLAIVYAIVVGLFVFIGQKIARLMSEFQPLTAYGLDLAGAFLGVVGFGLLVFIGGAVATPAVWFAVVGIISLWLLRGARRHLFYGGALFLAIVLIVFFSSKGNMWSPYYSIQTKQIETDTEVFVNRFLHQMVIDFDAYPELKSKYLFPYYFKQPKNVLVLGAGSGNDVAIAKLAGVERVDAVEIDPSIARLGKELHPQKPYQAKGVNLYIDDARSFLKKSTKKYDMIVMGTLDSHVLLSAMSTVRLDNYVYTAESLKSIREHLTDDGIVVMLFSSVNDELSTRLVSIGQASFSDTHTGAYRSLDDALFNLVFLGGPGLATDRLHEKIKFQETAFFETFPIPAQPNIKTLPSDDWPYVYLFKKSIPSHYLNAVGLLLLVSLVGIVLVRERKVPMRIAGSSRLTFFMLGAAFLLLETKSITSLSLLFGSTWTVNLFVFATILAMLWLANFLVGKGMVKRVGVAYLFLFATLAINFILPTDLFLGWEFWSRSIAASVITLSPIFFAAIIFSSFFKDIDKKHIGALWGINLAGAMFGGLFEYTSMAFGLNMLYIVVGVFYLISCVIAWREGKLRSV